MYIILMTTITYHVTLNNIPERPVLYTCLAVSINRPNCYTKYRNHPTISAFNINLPFFFSALLK